MLTIQRRRPRDNGPGAVEPESNGNGRAVWRELLVIRIKEGQKGLSLYYLAESYDSAPQFGSRLASQVRPISIHGGLKTDSILTKSGVEPRFHRHRDSGRYRTSLPSIGRSPYSAYGYGSRLGSQTKKNQEKRSRTELTTSPSLPSNAKLKSFLPFHPSIYLGKGVKRRGCFVRSRSNLNQNKRTSIANVRGIRHRR